MKVRGRPLFLCLCLHLCLFLFLFLAEGPLRSCPSHRPRCRHPQLVDFLALALTLTLTLTLTRLPLPLLQLVDFGDTLTVL